MLNLNTIIVKILLFLVFSAEYRRFVCANCEMQQWQCVRGECINIENLCDGVNDCVDGSDETPVACLHIACPPYAFRCAYGACVSKNLVCDNFTDCADGSDETKFLCDKKLEKESVLQGSCLQPLQFQCRNGECIERDMICDGKRDCRNMEDETVRLCSNIPCDPYAFRCGYGGCIARVSLCDGQEDCADGSDESIELCTAKAEPNFCIIPNQRRNLEIEEFNSSKVMMGGANVAYGTRLKFKCSKGQHLLGSERSICDRDGWSHEVPHCTSELKSRTRTS